MNPFLASYDSQAGHDACLKFRLWFDKEFKDTRRDWYGVNGLDEVLSVKGLKLLNDCIEKLLPLVGIAARVYASPDSVVFDDLCQDSVVILSGLIVAKSFKLTRGPAATRGYLKVALINKLADSYRKKYAPIFVDKELIQELQVKNPFDIRRADSKMMLDVVPALVKAELDRTLIFTGHKLRICQYMGKLLTRREKVDLGALSSFFKRPLPEIKILYNYTSVHVRLALDVIWEEAFETRPSLFGLAHRTGSERVVSTVDQGGQECLVD